MARDPLDDVVEGIRYGVGGRLEDDEGRQWRRVRAWVEPVEADQLVADGVSLAVQRAGSSAIKGWRADRYVRDLRLFMVTRAEARRYRQRRVEVQAHVAELWRADDESGASPELLVFVQRHPLKRSDAELAALLV